MLLFRRLAGCVGPGTWCDGSTAGGRWVRRWWRRLLARRLFHAAEVGRCEFSFTYSTGSLAQKRRFPRRPLSLSLSGGGGDLGEVGAVVMPTVVLPLEGGPTSQPTRTEWFELEGRESTDWSQ